VEFVPGIPAHGRSEGEAVVEGGGELDEGEKREKKSSEENQASRKRLHAGTSEEKNPGKSYRKTGWRRTGRIGESPR
jgi:hypothetical protein